MANLLNYLLAAWVIIIAVAALLKIFKARHKKVIEKLVWCILLLITIAIVVIPFLVVRNLNNVSGQTQIN